MENMDYLTNLFTNVAFPFAMCIIMCAYIYLKDKKETLKDELHKNEIDKLSEAIENNTKVMEKFLLVVDREGKE